MFNIIKIHRWLIIQSILFLLVTTLGIWGYLVAGNSISDAVFSTVRLLILELDIDDKLPWQIEIARFSAVAFVAIAIIKIIFTLVDNKVLQPIRMNFVRDHIVACGLGPISVSYLRSEDDNNIAILTEDDTDPQLGEFKERGIEVLMGKLTSQELFRKARIEKSRHILIASGDDMHNIEIASSLVKYAFNHAKELSISNEQISLIIHLTNRSLFALFEEGGLGAIANEFMDKNRDLVLVAESRSEAKEKLAEEGIDSRSLQFEEALEDEASKILQHKLLDIRVVSYFQETAKLLINEHPIEGESTSLIDTDTAFSVAIVGHSVLALNLLESIFKTAHYPHENKLCIHYVCDNAYVAEQEINRQFFQWKENKNIEIKFIEQNYEHKAFYDENIWQEKNLTNIYLTYEDDASNLKIAMSLFEQIYFRDAVTSENRHPKILFFMGEEKQFGAFIDKNKVNFEHFYSFGRINTIFQEENLIDQRHEDIAKLIYFDKRGELNSTDLDLSNPEKRSGIEYKWNDAILDEKNQAQDQASHIDIKLKALGLKRIKCEQNVFEENKNTFSIQLQKAVGKDSYDSIMQNYAQLQEIVSLVHSSKTTDEEKEAAMIKGCEIVSSFAIFSEKTINLFDKLVISEHNRWKTSLLINGWKRDDEDKKHQKLHPCLVSLKEIPDNQRHTIYNEWSSVLNLAKHTAAAGYKLIPIEK